MGSNATEGAEAPDFDLPADGDSRVRLSKLRGRTVVLYFYPKDDTQGCTREAIDFSALAPQFDSAGAVVIGMSPDPASAHDRFKAKHELTVNLVSDEQKDTLEAYGVWTEKSMYGRKFMGVVRSTFLIDKTGVIRKVWRNVKVSGHASAVLEAANSLET
jgi:thioredoxin-dependent peroxiredoxin